ncbi:MAG TPA: hypothetical protein G4O12_09085 [Dehalococcoidia bacterium]|nr:hypothetical protein [Dehalococcoidia bacterium]
MDKAKNKSEDRAVIMCICGRTVAVEVIGGQYQDTYYGECECGRKWSLEELTAALEELSQESTA